MKKHSSLVITSLLLSTGCSISERKSEVVDNQKATSERLEIGSPLRGTIAALGAASEEFIPAEPVALSGFGSIHRRFVPPLFNSDGRVSFCRPYEKVLNPPRIKAAVIDLVQSDGKSSKLFIVSLDLVAVTKDITRKINQTIDSLFSSSTSTLNNTLVLATHTHSGPAGLTESPLWSAFVCDQFNKDLTDLFLQKVKKVVQTAAGRSQPIGTLEMTNVNQPQLFKSRFSGMASASEVNLTTFKTQTGEISLSLVQLAAHPTFYGPRDLTLSADLVASVETEIQKSTGAKEVFMLQTTVGNMDAELNGLSPESWAQKLALEIKQSGKTSASPLSISTAAGLIPLPSASINWSACGASIAQPFVSLPILNSLPNEAPYTLWKIGKSAQIFLPGEWTTTAAEQIKAAISPQFEPSDQLKIYSLANEYTAYHVSQGDYSKKELESCSSVYGDSAVDQISASLRSAVLNPKE